MTTIDPEEPHEGELLAELRADWHAMGRGTDMPTEALEEQDLQTQAAVSWMQDAWTSLSEEEVPPMPMALARSHRAQGSPMKRRRVLWVASALAAVALAVAGAAILSSDKGPGPAPGALTEGQVAGSPLDADRSAPTAISPSDLERPRAAAPIPTFTPDQFVSRTDGLEIVTGNVRIILLSEDR